MILSPRRWCKRAREVMNRPVPTRLTEVLHVKGVAAYPWVGGHVIAADGKLFVVMESRLELA